MQTPFTQHGMVSATVGTSGNSSARARIFPAERGDLPNTNPRIILFSLLWLFAHGPCWVATPSVLLGRFSVALLAVLLVGSPFPLTSKLDILMPVVRFHDPAF